MKKTNILIYLLILLVSSILIFNTLYNHWIARNTLNVYKGRNSINLILTYIDEMEYISILIEDRQNKYLLEESNSLENVILSLKKKEFEIIEKISELCRNEVTIDENFDSLLQVFNIHKLEYENYFDSSGVTDNLKWSKNHAIITLNLAIKQIEKELFRRRTKLKFDKAIYEKIYFTDIIQSLLIVVITAIIIKILINENRKQAELVANFKQLNSTKDKFFSIISHDLRNPFNTLLGFSSLLKDNPEKYSMEKIKEFAENIYQTSKKTFGLLENLLQWSSLQTGNMEPNLQQVSLNEIIIDVIQLLKTSADEKNINITFDDSVDYKIVVDKNMVLTVFRNLVSNAIKFTETNGKIEIEYHKNMDNISIFIKDNGIGIEKNNVDKIFEIETKVSTIGTMGEKGTGLGLSLCKELVEINKGEIKVESEVGVGSVFKVSFPVIIK